MKQIRKQANTFKRVRILFFIIFDLLLYFKLAYDYVNGSILPARKSFLFTSILFWLFSALLYHRKTVNKILNDIHGAKKYLDYILFIIVPFGAFAVTETAYNPLFFDIPFSRAFLNFIIYMGIQIGLVLIFRNCSVAYSVLLIFAWLFGVANYYVMKFKGNPLLPSDLLAYKTAAQVAGNYQLTLSDSIVFSTLLLMAFMCIVFSVLDQKRLLNWKKAIIGVAAGIAWLGIFVSIVYNINWRGIFNIVLSAWSPQDSYYENGTMFAFLMESQDLLVAAPKGYSKTEVAGYMDGFNSEKTTVPETDSRPSVIVIMNESFADLKVIGDFKADKCLTNWENINQFVMRGNAYASVRGGGTCNSEFEFLTGSSMANLPNSVYPYQMYNFEQVFNLASEFFRNGYETIAIHPENKYNWNRKKVYSEYGFESFLSIDEFEYKEYYRYYISDAADFQQVISSYENSEEPVFIFNITMQNHGGYNIEHFSKDTDFVEIEKKFRLYEDVIAYLTLIRESDKAFTTLLEYFSQVKEPVIICMFGDHQPAIDDEFIEELLDSEELSLEERQKLYCVPYIIWSNYDTGITNVIQDTSLNYLGMDVLEIAGISSPYSQFLTSMQREIPIINALGYQTSDKVWHSFNEENEMVNRYRKLQYYMLFE